MPIYEFECNSCGHEFEKIVSFSSTQAPACPACEKDSVTRRMGRPAIHFKGSGWYITDSKKGNGSSGSNSNGGSAAKSEGTTKADTSTKSESTDSSAKSESESKSVKAEAVTADA